VHADMTAHFSSRFLLYFLVALVITSWLLYV